MTTKPFWQARSLAELSDVACHLLDCDSCRCRNYEKRTELVADCVKLRPGDREQLSWMPSTCAYRLLDAGKPLPEWHPLISGTTQSVRDAGISVSGRCVSEEFVHEDEIEFRIVDWVTTEA